jgi:hypothetical protein
MTGFHFWLTSCRRKLSLSRLPLAVLLLVSLLSLAGCDRSKNDDVVVEHSTGERKVHAEELLEPKAEVRGLAELLRPGAIILFGELHGTNEAPAFVANAAGLAAQSKLGARVGVEVPINMQSRVDKFLLSAGTEDDVKQLTQSSFWDGRDGRSSEALVSLFDKIRRLKQAGKDVDVYLFDIALIGSGSRDESMAKNILAAVAKSPAAVHLILTGNVHARTGSKRWMGWHIRQRHPQLISLNIAHSGGTAWVHTEQGIGPTKFRGKDQGSVPFVKRVEAKDESDFDGYYYVGNLSASPPATLATAE